MLPADTAEAQRNCLPRAPPHSHPHQLCACDWGERDVHSPSHPLRAPHAAAVFLRFHFLHCTHCSLLAPDASEPSWSPLPLFPGPGPPRSHSGPAYLSHTCLQTLDRCLYMPITPAGEGAAPTPRPGQRALLC